MLFNSVPANYEEVGLRIVCQLKKIIRHETHDSCFSF